LGATHLESSVQHQPMQTPLRRDSVSYTVRQFPSTNRKRYKRYAAILIEQDPLQLLPRIALFGIRVPGFNLVRDQSVINFDRLR
jgi:hypothetical protein